MGSYALVNVPVLALRGEPDDNSVLVDEALYGMKLEILEAAANGYLKVKTHYRYTGYAREAELITDDEYIKAWESKPHAVVYKMHADVMDGAAYKSIIKHYLPRGAQVTLEGEYNDNGFTKIGLCDGSKAYIKAGFLGECADSMYMECYSPDKNVSEFLLENYELDEETFRNRVATTAMLYLGTQYRWGGKSTFGIDCSGLASMSYMLNGLIIYRDAKIVEGFPIREITREELKTGDLMFFEGHVAIYIGEGRYVHSTGKNGSDGVVLNSMNPDDSDYREDLDKGFLKGGTVF